MLAQWACASNANVSSSFLLISQVCLVFLFLLSVTRQCLAQQSPGSMQDVPIPNQDPQITYSPFLCNTSNNVSFDAECNGGWQVLVVDETQVVATQGPNAATAGIIPQMFLRVRASAVIITTSSLSNATMNVTVSAGDASVNVQANSSLGVVGIFNLYEAEITTIVLTYISEAGVNSSRLDVGTITAQVTGDQASSSILPTATLPPSVSVPEFIPPATSSSSPVGSSSSNNHKQLVADAVGLTVGLGLGLTAVCVVGYLFWKRKRRKGPRGDAETQQQQQQQQVSQGSTGGASGSRSRSRSRTRRNKDNQDTRWF
ncbi:hypothetical protein VKT23_017089 [Stygiomarasmius scandens]|uniref:Mid2 domain-containing protein n=1 Tax=Marasmiellus scandens TaxID=2682957 RepID=A0ABR1IXC4_9AGAR